MPDRDDTLQTLETAGLVRVAQLEPELEYLFRHELIRDAAYNAILKQDRRELHLMAGEAIERLYPGRIEELAPVLAYHFEQADDAERAVRYTALAGEIARRKYANQEAATHYAHALNLARRHNQTEQLQTFFQELGHALEQTGRYPEALATYIDMRDTARQSGDKAMELEALLLLLTLYATPTSVFDIGKAHGLSGEALDLARALGNRRAESAVLWNLSMVNSHSGQLEEAIRYGEESLSIARELNARERIAYGLNDLASFIYVNARHVQRGKQALLEARQLWVELNNPTMEADSLSTLARYEVVLGHYDAAMAASAEARRIADAIDNPWGRSYSRFAIGNALFARGEIGQTIACFEDGMAWAEKAGFAAALIGPRSTFGLMLGLLGQPERGLVLAEQALALTENVLTTWNSWPLGNLVRLHILQGDLTAAKKRLKQIEESNGLYFLEAGAAFDLVDIEYQMATGNFAEAERLARSWVDYAESAMAQTFVPGAQLALARALIAQGKGQEAIAPLERGFMAAEEMTARWDLWRILAALADVKQDEGFRSAARGHVAYIAGSIDDAGLKAAFLGLKEVKALG